MAKILFTTLGSLGDLHPPMGLAKEMQKRGHSVTLAVSEYYRDYVEGAGLSFKPVRPNIEPNNKDILRAVLEPIHGSRVLHESFIFPSMEAYYADLYPLVKDSDLFVSSILGYVAPLLAKTTGTQWVNALLSPMVLWSAYEPPVLPPIAWFRFLWGKTPRLNKFILDTIFKCFGMMSEPLQLLRDSVGLPRVNIYKEGQHSVPLLLCLWSPLFGSPQLDWPPSASATGFVFYDPTQEFKLSNELQSYLNKGSAPLIFTLGSTMVEDSVAQIELFIEVAHRSHERAIITVGKNHLEKYQKANSEKLLFIDYAPYEKLFPTGKLIIHQGGVGTTGQALQSGKPMLITPSCMDQIDNAVRIKKMGAGNFLMSHKLSSETLLGEIKLLINSKTQNKRSELLGRQIKRENGIARAANELEKLL